MEKEVSSKKRFLECYDCNAEKTDVFDADGQHYSTNIILIELVET